MTISQRMHAQVALVVLIVVGLAAAGWVLIPAKAITSMVAISTMAAIWFVVAFIGFARPFAEQSASERRFLAASVAAAGAILAVSLGKKIADAFGLFGGVEIERALGIGAGVLLVLLGNTMPKVLSPLTAKRCAPSQVQAIQRFTGWLFVLAGLASIASWLFQPIEQAQIWSMIATAAALVLVVLRNAWAFVARSSPLGR